MMRNPLFEADGFTTAAPFKAEKSNVYTVEFSRYKYVSSRIL